MWVFFSFLFVSNYFFSSLKIRLWWFSKHKDDESCLMLLLNLAPLLLLFLLIWLLVMLFLLLVLFCLLPSSCHLVDLPVDPYRYRYSPERLKKASSFQSDEFPRDSRHGRRQSGNSTNRNRVFVSTLSDRLIKTFSFSLFRAKQTNTEEQQR